MDITTISYLSAVITFTLVAAVCDLRSGKLPNWLTVPALLAALAFHGATGGATALLSSLAGFAVGFGVLLVLWLIGGGGAGDVKMMGALGGWLGAKLTLYVFLASTIVLVLTGVAVLLVQTLRRGYGWARQRYLDRLDPRALPKNKALARQAVGGWRRQRRVMPYALPVALGTWAVLAWRVLSAES